MRGGGPTSSANDFARRDRFVVWVANRVLRLTSRHYQRMVGGAILLGLGAAASEPCEDEPDPLDSGGPFGV